MLLFYGIFSWISVCWLSLYAHALVKSIPEDGFALAWWIYYIVCIFTQVLAIDARNDAQLSGLLVVTSPENAFYSSPTEHGWRCTPASESDTDLTWTQLDYDDSQWQTATSRGVYVLHECMYRGCTICFRRFVVCQPFVKYWNSARFMFIPWYVSNH